jgi:hypothetical protein
MPIIHSPESAYVKEMRKWNKPYKYRPFPKMVYRARETPDGRTVIQAPMEWQDSQREAFNSGCQRIVHDEDELHRALESGWREGPDAALEYAKERHNAIADAAAHRYHEDARLSEAAQREAKEREAALTDGVAHVPELPEQPREGVRCTAVSKRSGKPCTWKAVPGTKRCKKHSN